MSFKMYFVATSLNWSISFIIELIGSTSSSLFPSGNRTHSLLSSSFLSESPSWFVSHSSIPCTCSYLWCDNTWVHNRVTSRSHPTSALPRLCNRTEWRTCFVVFDVSSPPCSWTQATVVFAPRQIQVCSTHIRDIARSMPCFPQSDTYAFLWDHQLVYEELHVSVSLLPPLTSYSHPIPYLTLILVNQEWVNL